MNAKIAKEFLSMFQFSGEGKNKAKLIEYVLSTTQKAIDENKVLEFTELEKLENLPNPFVDHSGKLFVNTTLFQEMVDDYERKTRYTKTEVAKVVRETYLILHTEAERPLEDPDK